VVVITIAGEIREEPSPREMSTEREMPHHQDGKANFPQVFKRRSLLNESSSRFVAFSNPPKWRSATYP
jgi:hypothetical protein